MFYQIRAPEAWPRPGERPSLRSYQTVTPKGSKMTTTVNQTRLLGQLANLIALEAAIEQRVKEWIPLVVSHSIIGTQLEDFRALSRDHCQALETRLITLTGHKPPYVEAVTAYATGDAADAAEYPVSSALQEIYTLYNQALIGYAVLGSLSSRELDSSCVADDGTSEHLAVQHTNDYVAAVQKISRLINDVLLWEFDRDGAECQCCCPSCSAGICLCAAWWRNVLSEAWSEAGRINNDKGIYVQQPKQGSAATQSGLDRGDIILAVEGHAIESLSDVQSALRDSQPGAVIQLTVHRHSGELEEITLVSPKKK